MTQPTDKVLATLRRFGLLLKQDKSLPNVVTLVTGESLHGSWWSHPKAHVIFATLSELAEHPDVLLAKLLSGKDTLVHRSLLPALLAVVSAGGPWQDRNLSANGRKLLKRVAAADAPVRSSGPIARELQLRLLVHAEQVHTESGRHETALETWSAWSVRVGVSPVGSAAEARRALERACRGLGALPSALPWSEDRSRRKTAGLERYFPKGRQEKHGQRRS